MRAVMTMFDGAGVKAERYRDLGATDEGAVDELLELKGRLYP
jgi:hypothetical protein